MGWPASWVCMLVVSKVVPHDIMVVPPCMDEPALVTARGPCSEPACSKAYSTCTKDEQKVWWSSKTTLGRTFDFKRRGFYCVVSGQRSLFWAFVTLPLLLTWLSSSKWVFTGILGTNSVSEIHPLNQIKWSSPEEWHSVVWMGTTERR